MSTEQTAESNIRASGIPQTRSMSGTNPAAGAATSMRANPVAFLLSAAGLGIQAFALVMTLLVSSTFPAFFGRMFGMMGYYGGMMGPYYGTGWYGTAWVWFAVALVAIAIGAVGLAMMNSSAVGRVRNGAVLVLLSAVFAFPTMWGFWIGSVLMFVGAIMGLTTAENRPQGSPQ